MSSSIKALANSFGFKRAASVKSNSSRSTATSSSMPSTVGDGEELAQYSTPYSSLPEVSPSAMPQTDHFKFSTPDTTIADHHSDSSVAEPVPGQGSRAGMPAPANARLSTGAGATTTIRLVSASSTFSRLSTGPGTPQLKVFNPAFDLILGSPGGEGEPRVPVWPLSPGGPSTERLYPALPWGDFIKTSKEEEAAIGGDDVDMPGAIAPPQITVSTPAKSSPSKSHHTPRTFPTPSNEPIDLFSPAPASLRTPKDGPSIPRSQPFIFGSPLPQHNVSNKAFGNAAATVLEEMNRRLSAVGGQKVGMELLERSQPANTDGGGSIFGDLGSLSKVDRFEKAHNAQFNKMDSILTHYAAKRAAPASKKRKSSVLGRGAAPAKKRVSAETRVISAGGRKRMGIPGGFGDEDEDEEDIDNGEESRRMSKRVRVLEGDGGMDKGKRVSIAPTEKDKKKAEKERDAVRRALDAKREKRRSSIRRVSGIAPPSECRLCLGVEALLTIIS
ncbi:hypothetical protein BV25DRAFT_1002327 [Artomyces pyxidatus]|uniref:Uncharacterized protein n=1 Tax=Artomyces pyxidatus TaxID=48021 RepID=A0ACB8SUX3_9AGAM|nr:hypothetical protein BV25DRAFT_1002327 [Artomyces pyxidatus]